MTDSQPSTQPAIPALGIWPLTTDARSYQDIATDPTDDDLNHGTIRHIGQPPNTVEPAEDAARRYAGQLLDLERGLTQRHIQPSPTAPVDTWAVPLALAAIDRARTDRDHAEARAGAYRLSHDHLATVTRTLIDRATATIGPDWRTPVRGGIREALDTARDVLSRDLESYLPEPYNPDTRVTLTPAGQRAASVPRDARETPPEPHASSPSWTPLSESWGPYATELQTRLEPMPVTVGELHDAGLIESGDPGQVVQTAVLAHLKAACEAARIELGAYDRTVLEWLARGELGVAQVVIGLIRRTHSAGRTTHAEHPGSMP